MYGVNEEGSKSLGQYHLTVFDYPDIVAGLRHQEKCMDSDSADHLWFLLRNAIQQIYRKHHSHLQFEELYRYGYGLVMYKKGELLYTGLHDVIAEHIKNKVQSKVLANLNSNFLHTINNAWEEHKPAMDMIGDIFMYMDRVYVPQNKLDSVYTIGLNLFKELVVRNSRIQAFLQETLLEMVMKERQGELVDRSTFRSTTRMLMQLGSQAADEAKRMCQVLQNRSQQDEERMDQLTNQLKEARMLAEDADGKSDEVSRKLAFVEDELEVAEDRVKSGDSKIMELEEELKVVGNSLKSLEVSEEKANQRVEEYKQQIKQLTVKLKEAEARAEFAEKTVKKLQKEVDRLEDELGLNKDRYKSLADEMDSTFAELAGY